MAVTARKRLPREERVDAILVAARKTFSDKGYEAAVMVDIAAAAGLSEAALYKFFASKRDLFISVIEQWYGELITVIEADLPQIEDTMLRLRYLVGQHLHTFADEPGLCRAMLQEARTMPDYVGGRFQECNRRYTGFMLKTLKAGAAEGVVRDDLPPAFLRDAIFGAVEHHCFAYLSGRAPMKIEKVTDQFWLLLQPALLAGSTD
ncbi:MAG: TetR/AcrR family transcriptional regulator [Alphaproteobacteria bacterium]